MVENSKSGKMRGYAFVEFEKERDMHGKCDTLSNVKQCPAKTTTRPVENSVTNTFGFTRSRSDFIFCSLFEQKSASKNGRKMQKKFGNRFGYFGVSISGNVFDHTVNHSVYSYLTNRAAIRAKALPFFSWLLIQSLHYNEPESNCLLLKFNS